jgi:hypothetical protein
MDNVSTIIVNAETLQQTSKDLDVEQIINRIEKSKNNVQ